MRRKRVEGGMSVTLAEILQQIDRNVLLDNGLRVQSVREWLQVVDVSDAIEFVLRADSIGRLNVHRLDVQGRAIQPPAFIEHKCLTGTSPSGNLFNPASFQGAAVYM